MNLRIGICDDEEKQCHSIADIVNQWALAHNHTVKIEIFNGAESFLFQYPINSHLDIILLDVEMGEINGVGLAKKIRQTDENIQIIFITGYMEYIADGYEVAALHYLMKPLDATKLAETLNRAIIQMKKNEQEIWITNNQEIYKILLRDIKYIEVNSNYISIHGKEVYKVKRTLKDIQNDLDENFFKIGRSYILNLAYISRITKKQVFLVSGDTIPLPRGMYEVLNREIIKKM